MGLTERYGTGIKRILDICHNYGIIAQVFENRSSGFHVTMFKEKMNDPVNERISRILNYIKKNKHITRDEIADKCRVSIETIKRDIQKLKSNNMIRRIGSDKTGYWKILQ